MQGGASQRGRRESWVSPGRPDVITPYDALAQRAPEPDSRETNPGDDAVRARLTRQLAAGRVLLLSGAGLSTESGIPDYRGPDGARRVSPMLQSEFLNSGMARQRYWARSFLAWPRFRRAEPNTGHLAVAELQRLGLIESVITQNVDGLHQRAGSAGVVELHGTLGRATCVDCARGHDRDDLQTRMAADNHGWDAGDLSQDVQPDGDLTLPDARAVRFHPPTCLGCRGDRLKPDVVFFGGVVDGPLVEQCYRHVENARSVLVLGSSLAVMSGLRFVRRAHALGRPVGIISLLPTRGDAPAHAVWHARLGWLCPRWSPR